MPHPLEDVFFQHVPRVLAERMLRGVFLAHRLSFEHCRATYADTEAVNVRPYETRARLEGILRDIAELVPGVEHAVVRSAKSYWNHTEITAGPVVITANAVDEPGGLVRKSEFRETLARGNQTRLWHESGDVRGDDPPLFVALGHTKSLWDTLSERRQFGYLPGSAHLGFPDPDLNSNVHVVDLFAMFPAVVQEHLPTTWEAVVVSRYLSRSRNTSAAA